MDAEVMIGDEGFFAAEWSDSYGDTDFVLSGEEVHDLMS